MLHKADNLILADCILRLLRLDKRLKHIDGLIKLYINNEDNVDQGYTIELLKFNFGDIITFSVEPDGQILVYIYSNALNLLDKDFQDKKLFTNDHFVDAKEYIANAIDALIKNAKLRKLPSEMYNAL